MERFWPQLSNDYILTQFSVSEDDTSIVASHRGYDDQYCKDLAAQPLEEVHFLTGEEPSSGADSTLTFSYA